MQAKSAPVILLASSSPETLAHWEQSLAGLDVLSVRALTALNECLVRINPQLLLLDVELTGLDGAKGVGNLLRAIPSTKIIALTRFNFDELEIALFKSGVYGCCRVDTNAALAQRAVAAVKRGELWIRRSITPRLLNELATRVREESWTTGTAEQGLADLTSREREIAQLIGNGESNKQIARQLLITERTVKAHVSGIFRKLGIGDRLSLALRVSALREVASEHAS